MYSLEPPIARQTTEINSDQIREHVRIHRVEPARQQQLSGFSVRAGDIEKELGMRNRIAHVCTALRSNKFLKSNGLELVNVAGPPSGTSTTVVFTYQFSKPVPAGNSAPTQSSSPVGHGQSLFDLLRETRGIAKDLYVHLGGAEEALAAERRGWPE